MLFTSPLYILYLFLVFFIFNSIPDRTRWLLLLVAGIIFYASWNSPSLLLVISLVIIITYVCGLKLENCTHPRKKLYRFWFGVILNLLILIFMKYFPFLAGWALKWFPNNSSENPTLSSIGVSYYVFQAISYLIDVYLEVEKPERHFGYFALYLSFFPKLLQGPIERAGNLIPQLRGKYIFDYNNFREGLILFTLGWFKKTVLADPIGIIVNSVYNHIHTYSGFSLWLVTYLFAIQIYCDFSGYTDMALGSARIFNIKLTPNFNCPYFANSIADFWRRWHISFSRWILDYIFKPLQIQFRNWGNWGTAFALIITFLLSGLWHGVGFCFVIWGLIHGIYLALSVFYRPLQKTVHKQIGLNQTQTLKIWQTAATFHLVCFSWIFFRANSVSDAYYIITHLFPCFPMQDSIFLFTRLKFTLGMHTFFPTLFGITFIPLLFIMDLLQRQRPLYLIIIESSWWIRWSVYYLLLMLILIFSSSKGAEFIYFQF